MAASSVPIMNEPVVLKGFASADLNGAAGVCVGMINENGRVPIAIHGGTKVLVRPDNIQRMGEFQTQEDIYGFHLLRLCKMHSL